MAPKNGSNTEEGSQNLNSNFDGLQPDHQCSDRITRTPNKPSKLQPSHLGSNQAKPAASRRLTHSKTTTGTGKVAPISSYRVSNRYRTSARYSARIFGQILNASEEEILARSMNDTGASEKDEGKEPKQTQAGETTKPKPIETPAQPARWDTLIPRQSPLLGPQYISRAQANPRPDEATKVARGQEEAKTIQAMIYGQHIPRTARDINLALHANQQIPPAKQIQPPQPGTAECKYIQEQTIPWSERRKCQLLNIIPGEAANVYHRPQCHEENKFLENHFRKFRHPHYMRTTPGTDGVHPERTFNGLLSFEEWQRTTMRDMQEWKVVPPYTMDNGQGKRVVLGGWDAGRAQHRGLSDEFKTGNTGMFRRHYFLASHHTERDGEEEVVVVQGQAFRIWKSGELMEGYRRDSEVDWIDFGANAMAGDLLLWEDDGAFLRNGRSEGSGDWMLEGTANEDAFERVLGDGDLEGERYVLHTTFRKHRERDLVRENEEMERLRRYEWEGV